MSLETGDGNRAAKMLAGVGMQKGRRRTRCSRSSDSDGTRPAVESRYPVLPRGMGGQKKRPGAFQPCPKPLIGKVRTRRAEGDRS